MLVCMVPVAWDLWLLSGDSLHEALTRHHPGELLGVHHKIHPRNWREYAKKSTLLQSHTSGERNERTTPKTIWPFSDLFTK